MKLDKGPRGFGFSLVAAPTFNSNVSEWYNFGIQVFLTSDLSPIEMFCCHDCVVGPRNFYQDNKPRKCCWEWRQVKSWWSDLAGMIVCYAICIKRIFFCVWYSFYLNQVNGEDVQGLSHARVIGMLRKITGTVELEIRRYAPLHKKNFFLDLENTHYKLWMK